mgnify:CR=1 FL=1
MTTQGNTIRTTPAGAVKTRVRFASIASLLAVAAIVAVGLFLRWDRLQYAEFNWDQAWSLAYAYDFVNGGAFPLRGIESSLRTAQGPIEIYLLSIPLLLSKDPLVATAFVGLLQALAVAGTYVFAGRYYGTATGLIAAALHSTNAWAVHFSRTIWTQDMMPPLLLLFFTALYASVIGRRRIYLGISCALLTTLFLTHASAIFYGPLLLTVIVVFWRRLGWASLALGAGLSLVVASPYLKYQFQSGFSDLTRYGNLAAGDKAQVDVSSIKYMVDMALAQQVRGWLLGWPPESATAAAVRFADQLVTVLLALGIAVATWRLVIGLRSRDALPRTGWEEYFLLLLWFSAPIVMSIRHPVTIWNHYFIATWPVQFILVGLALSSIADLARRGFVRLAPEKGWLGPVAAGLVTLTISVSQASVSWEFAESVDRSGAPLPWVVPLGHSQKAIETVRILREQLGAPAYVYCSTNQWIGLEYLARPSLKIERVVPAKQLVLPRDLSLGALMVVEVHDTFRDPPLGFEPIHDSSPVLRAARRVGFTELADYVIGSACRPHFRFFYLAPDKAVETVASFQKVASRLELGNGLRLVGYKHSRAVEAGDSLTISVLWQMPEDPGAYGMADQNLVARLTDVAGRELAKGDWEIFPYRQLGRAGEYLVSEYELEVPAGFPPGQALLHLGAHDRHTQEQAVWLLPSGKPGGGAYVAGAIEIAPAANQSDP